MNSNDEMVTTSIYIRKRIWERLKDTTGRNNVSSIVDMLIEKWLDDEIDISIKPKKKGTK